MTRQPLIPPETNASHHAAICLRKKTTNLLINAVLPCANTERFARKEV